MPRRVPRSGTRRQADNANGQFKGLEAAERVVARYQKGRQTRKVASAKTPTAATKSVVPGHSRTATAKTAGGRHSSFSLGEQVLALAIEITAACKGARPNHVGAAIARHKRAGRIEERDGKLNATQSVGTKQRAAV
jgi:hypothetical protein